MSNRPKLYTTGTQDKGVKIYKNFEIINNWYGCDVLQTPDMFITDIDDKESLDKVVETIIKRRFPAYVYETTKGYRVINPFFKFPVKESMEIQKEMGADEKYTTICDEQRVYRARLEPKPWRVELQVCRLKFDLSFGYKPDNSLLPQFRLHQERTEQ